MAGNSWIVQHWRGDVPLARAWWCGFVAAPMLILLASNAALAWMGEHVAARHSSQAALAMIGLTLLVWIWSIRGTWRSARLHTRRGGARRWATLAQCVLVADIGALAVVDCLLLPTSVSEHWQVAGGMQAGTPMTVRTLGETIALDGGINDGAADSIAQQLAHAPGVTRLRLASSGGWIREGKLIADVVRRNALDTRVDGECSSACTIAFLAGRRRSLGPHGRLGFHAFRVVGASKSADAAMRATYANAGLSDGFIAKVARIPPSTMWYPAPEELLRERVITMR